MDAFRMTLLSRMEDLPGFCSVSMLVDRRVRAVGDGGRLREPRRHEPARPRRGRCARSSRRQMSVDITEVAEFDLALAHLRVPETV